MNRAQLGQTILEFKCPYNKKKHIEVKTSHRRKIVDLCLHG